MMMGVYSLPRRATIILAREADKEFCVPEPACPLSKRLVAGLVFNAMRQVRPDQTRTCNGSLIEAHNAVTQALQVAYDLAPAMRVLPLFAGAAGLDGNKHIGFGKWPRVVRYSYARRFLCRVDTKNVGCRAMQTHQPEITGLPHILIIIEKEPETVGGIGCLVQLVAKELRVVTKRMCG